MFTQAAEVKEIAAIAFPGYGGHKFRVKPFNGPMRLDSSWQDGSRDYFTFVHLADKRTVTVQENGTPFSNGGQIMQCSELPMNVCLVEHSISCGRDVGITIYLREENLSKLLPAPFQLTRDQRIVLAATRGLKSSYGGIKDYRFHSANRDTGIERPEWDQARAELIARGLLKNTGAISDEGHNAIGMTSLWELKGVLQAPEISEPDAA